MTLSVVIATYNRPLHVRRLVEQIRQWDMRIRIVIVDQSEQPTFSETERKKYSLTLFQLEKPNLPVARNIGWSHSDSDIVLFLDDDVEVSAQTLAVHRAAYQQNDVVGVAGRVVNASDILPDNLDVITGHANAFFTRFEWKFWSTRPQIVDFPYGCNMSFRRDVLEKIQGFDEGFLPPVSAFEEVDAGLRAGRYGKLLFVPQASVIHLQVPHGGTRVSDAEKTVAYWYSYGRFLRKHLGSFFLILSFLRSLPRVLPKGPSTVTSFIRGILS